MAEDDLIRMLYVARPGYLTGNKISQLRIFDPVLQGDAAPIKKYADIDDDRRALLFDGHFFLRTGRRFSTSPTSGNSGTVSNDPAHSI